MFVMKNSTELWLSTFLHRWWIDWEKFELCFCTMEIVRQKQRQKRFPEVHIFIILVCVSTSMWNTFIYVYSSWPGVRGGLSAWSFQRCGGFSLASDPPALNEVVDPPSHWYYWYLPPRMGGGGVSFLMHHEMGSHLNRMTNSCENITIPRITHVFGNNYNCYHFDYEEGVKVKRRTIVITRSFNSTKTSY